MNTLTNTKIIGLDMDGVIIDHTENRIRFAKEFGFSLAPEEAASDIMRKKIPRDTYEKIQKLLYDDPTTGLSLPLVSGAKSSVELLRQSEILYYLISRRGNPQIGRALLQKRGLWPELFNEKNTFFVKTIEDKNDKARELGVTIYLDDQPSVLDALVDIPQKFLFDPLYAYAKHSEHAQYNKIHSWDKFIQVVKNL